MKKMMSYISFFGLILIGQFGIAQSSQMLSDSEKEDLAFLLEEEKLARDIYVVFHEEWGLRAFDNISKAEQKHMDKLHNLAVKHGLAIPYSIQKNQPGTFDNEVIQSLYDESIVSGRNSIVEALKSGVEIEETDISDLITALENTKNPQLQKVYTNLKEASERHLQTYVKNLTKRGVEYSSEYLAANGQNGNGKGLINKACKAGKEAGAACCKNSKSASASIDSKANSNGNQKAACCSDSKVKAACKNAKAQP